jgi:cytochrome c oxidase subunit 3
VERPVAAAAGKLRAHPDRIRAALPIQPGGLVVTSSAGSADHTHRDHVGAKLGMWIFLFTELILFGGLFLLYSAYRRLNPSDFHHASQELNLVLGVVNTLVLLTSSLTMALSISAIRQGKKRHSTGFLAATILLGCLFLVNKYFEWTAKIHHGIYPGSPSLMQREPGERLFFGLYYTMTGLHGVHVVVGLSVLLVMLWLLGRDRIRQDAFIMLENTGLYWHLVDIVWIFLLPLFYLAA